VVERLFDEDQAVTTPRRRRNFNFAKIVDAIEPG